jgi:methylamine dehydrogenase accessory protein MauD
VSGGVWVASYVLLWLAVVVLALAVVALLRQVGVLHARLRPLGAHMAGEGPPSGAPAPRSDRLDYSVAALTLLAFTSPRCEVCRSLVPSLSYLERDYAADVQVVVLDHGPATAELFSAFNVHSTPYFVAVGPDGLVRGGGVANSLEQVEVLVEESLASAA